MSVPNIIGLPESPQSPADYHEWAKLVLAHRIRVHAETNHKNKSVRDRARARELVLISRSSMYLAAVYGGIYEARVEDINDPEDIDLGIMIPFIPYPFQIELWYDLDDTIQSKGPAGDAAWIKARDMGLSNLAAFWVSTKWLTKRVFQARILSRKEALVDQTGDPDSLFWKIQMFLMGIPDWIIQHFARGFDWKHHRMMNRLINPKNHNLISGESTQANAGRGGRATIIIYDEGCFIPDLRQIWTAGRGSTYHRLLISTVSVEEGLDCFNLVHGKDGYTQPRVIMVPWTEHPDHDLEWFAQEAARDSEEGIRREVLMDWNAGGGDWVYPETHTYATGPYPYIPGAGDFYVAIDDGYDDDFAIVFIQRINATGRLRVLDGYRNNHKPVDFYGSILRGIPRSNFVYNERELELMRWMREMPPFTAVGDPHVRHTEQVAGMSVYDRFLSEWGIAILVDPLQNKPKDLRTATGALLPLTDFNDTPGAAQVLEALQRWKFPKSTGVERVTEARNPIHSQYSHFASAFGYFAVNNELFKLIGEGGGGIKYVGSRNSANGPTVSA